jgi:hypothetical protein
MVLLGIFFLVLNIAISVLNAAGAGYNLYEARQAGGMALIMNWCGRIMSWIGFTYVISILFAFALVLINSDKYTELSEMVLNMGYITILIPLLSVGAFITGQSLINAWRHRSAGNIVAAVWNVGAMTHNTVSAVKFAPGIVKKIIDFARKNPNMAVWAFAIVLLSLVMGVIISNAITMKVYQSRLATKKASQPVAA